ncbi:MAG: histidine kinase [Gammaproteobacteria bacterium]|jgi:two-component system sensor histidine kinase AlgZ|nr:histidine kinase [Gammaproteobacteria bacterium]MDH3986078.1 histidine kinase [Gammaproteobacteria bacterium]
MSDQQLTDYSGIETVESFFLPSFCDVRMVFAVVVIAQLLAFIITLVSPGVMQDAWGNLGLISLFMQWIALTSAAMLCVCRPMLARMGNRVAAVVSYLLVLLVTAVVSELAFWLMLASTVFPEISVDQHAVFLLRNLTIATVIAAIVLRYLYVQFQWRQQLKAEARARIQALQARIRPHFLFNSMNTIAALTRSAPEVAETAIEDLSDLFRASLNTSQQQATLAEELTLARRYLGIEALRLGERLSVEWHMDGVPQTTVLPPLILQPLLENAIYHGIERLPEGGTIQVEGHCKDGFVTIAISNPVLSKTASEQPAGHRIAQENIRQRLQIIFGDSASLVSTLTAGVYKVVMHFPEEATS